MSAFNWKGTAMQIEQSKKRGRPMQYDDQERAQRHREAALRWYHRQGRQRRQEAEPCYFHEAGNAARTAIEGASA
jgi:hypothetical protein